MERRSFFAAVCGAIAAALLPYRETRYIVHDDRLLPQYWEITEAENVVFEGNVARAKDPTKPYSMTVHYITRNGYMTAARPVAGPWRFPIMPELR